MNSNFWGNEDKNGENSRYLCGQGDEESASRDIPFQLLVKNARGLASDDRLDELLQEACVATEDWDVIIITEIWRKTQREYFQTVDGHLFAGAGSDSGRRGVAFLINKRWARHVEEFCVINERIAFLRIRKHRWKF